MLRFWSMVAVAAVLAAVQAAQAGGGKDCCTPAPCCDCAPPPLQCPYEVKRNLLEVKFEKREVTTIVERLVPREFVTCEKCVEQVPVWTECKKCVTVYNNCVPETREVTEKVCTMECREKIIEHRCKVNEVVPEKKKEVVTLITLVPFTTVDTVVPHPCPTCAPAPCSSCGH
jgi:hypothetical protein